MAESKLAQIVTHGACRVSIPSRALDVERCPNLLPSVIGCFFSLRQGHERARPLCSPLALLPSPPPSVSPPPLPPNARTPFLSPLRQQRQRPHLSEDEDDEEGHGENLSIGQGRRAGRDRDRDKENAVNSSAGRKKAAKAAATTPRKVCHCHCHSLSLSLSLSLSASLSCLSRGKSFRRSRRFLAGGASFTISC